MDLRFSLLCLSAESPVRLAATVESALAGVQPRWSAKDHCRLSLVYSTPTELKGKLLDAGKFLAGHAPESRKAEPLGFYYNSSPAAAESVAFLYPGQGSQSVGMLAGLRSALPGFEDNLQRLDRMWQSAHGTSLLHLIYGVPNSEGENKLRDTRVAQPALGMASTALRISLEALGIRAQYHAGHSYGELPALCGAGFIDDQLLLSLSSERGKLLGEAGDLNPGSMLALNGGLDVIQSLCRSVHPSLELANINSPQQFVISGPDEAIAALEKAAGAAGMPARRLNTSCAFHSSLMASTARRWREVLQQKLPSAGKQGTARAFSNVTAKPYQDSGELVDLLGDQIVKPVRWADTCSELVRLRADVFVEVGPGRILSDLLARNLPSGACPLILAADPRQEDADQYVAHLFARLASRGVDVQWQIFAKPLEAPAPPPSAWSVASSFFDSGRTVLDQYFAQQTKLIELALQRCHASERQTLVQGALTANENVMKELLASQQAVILPLLGGSPAIPSLPMPQQPVKAEPAAVSEAPRDMPSRLEAILKAEISRVTGFPTQAITAAAKFNDLGIDSLSMVDIWTQVLEQIPELAGLADGVLEIHSLADARRAVSSCCAQAHPDTSAAKPPEVAGVGADTWTEVRERLMDAMSAVSGVDRSQFTATADFENDLGIDVFQRERIFNQVLSAHTNLRLPGRELLNARTLAELDELLQRFDSTADLSRTGLPACQEPVERWVLRDQAVSAEDVAERAGEMPNRMLLVGSQGSETLTRVLTLLQRSGRHVSTMSIASGSWSLNGRTVPLDSAEELRRALDTVLRQRVHGVVFLAEAGRKAEDALDRTTTSMFVLAQALWKQGVGSSSATELTILGSERDNPLADGTRGLARSLRRELPDLQIRTVWTRSSISDLDDALMLRALFSPGLPDEMEASDGELISRVLERKPQSVFSGESIARLTPSSRILVLGGGNGISAEISVSIAAAYRCEVIAVGRTPAPDSMPFPDIPFGPDFDAALKQRLFELMSVTSPVSGEALHREWRRASRQRGIWNTRERVEAAGGRFTYHAADVVNEESLRYALKAIQAGGAVDGIIHGAGMIKDNLLGRKSLDEFKEVVRTKAISAKILQESLASEPLQFVFFLSSMTSFTGTAGQTDYAAANQILNAIAHDWNTEVEYPVKSLLWSVWSDAGLAGVALKTHMARLGLSGIESNTGVRLLLNELRYGRKSEDWVLFAPLSTLNYSMQARTDSASKVVKVAESAQSQAVCQA